MTGPGARHTAASAAANATGALYAAVACALRAARLIIHHTGKGRQRVSRHILAADTAQLMGETPCSVGSDSGMPWILARVIHYTLHAVK